MSDDTRFHLVLAALVVFATIAVVAAASLAGLTAALAGLTWGVM